MIRKVLVVCLFATLPASLPLRADVPGMQADSLKKVLYSTDDPAEQIRTYLALAMLCEQGHPDSAMQMLDQARKLATQAENPKLSGEVFYSMGNIAVIRNNLDRAMAEYKVAAIFFQRAGDTLHYARMVMLMGNIYGIRNNTGAAMIKFMEAISLAEKHGYHAILSHLYNNVGDIYMQSEDRKKAMDYYTLALKEFIGNADSVNMGTVLVNIGEVYHQMGNDEMATSYVNRAMAIFTRSQDFISVALCLMDLGMIQSSQGKYAEALDLYTRALAHSKHGSKVYKGPQDFLRSEIMVRMGINYYRMGNDQEAKQYLLGGYHLAKAMKQPKMVVLAARNLSMLYEKLNAPTEALQYYKIYMVASDSLSKVISVRAIELTKARQEFIKTQKENELKIQYEQAEKRTMLIIYIISGVILLAVIIILFLLLKLEKQRKRQSETEKLALDDRLEHQAREMTTNVMYINKMNEQVVHLAEKLKSLTIEDNTENAQVIKSIIRDLGQDSQGDSLKEFEVRFQNVHQLFYRNLTDKYPDLTPNELKLCAYLRLNMSTKEISSLTYQSENSIMVARTRLRQKLGITRNENLVTFLSQF